VVTTIYTEPIDMEGFRRLQVEVRLLDDKTSADFVVQGSDDFDRKTWAGKGQAVNLVPGGCTVAQFTETGRTARVRVDVPRGISVKDIWIRLTRLD
jgi:hypothetical protein